MQIGLGLDLKGGMNVILEVSVPDVVKNLAGSNADNAQVKQIMAEARTEAEHSSENFLDVFVRLYQQKVGKDQLGGLFAVKLKSEGVTPNSTDAQVKAVLEKEIKAAATTPIRWYASVSTASVWRNPTSRSSKVADRWARSWSKCPASRNRNACASSSKVAPTSNSGKLTT